MPRTSRSRVNRARTVAIPYAATFTPDLSKADEFQVGALTGNIAINAPVGGQDGDVLVIALKQDGTGGRTITWNGVYINTPTTASAASARTTASFTFLDGVWQ